MNVSDFGFRVSFDVVRFSPTYFPVRSREALEPSRFMGRSSPILAACFSVRASRQVAGVDVGFLKMTDYCSRVFKVLGDVFGVLYIRKVKSLGNV